MHDVIIVPVGVPRVKRIYITMPGVAHYGNYCYRFYSLLLCSCLAVNSHVSAFTCVPGWAKLLPRVSYITYRITRSLLLSLLPPLSTYVTTDCRETHFRSFSSPLLGHFLSGITCSASFQISRSFYGKPNLQLLK